MNNLILKNRPLMIATTVALALAVAIVLSRFALIVQHWLSINYSGIIEFLIVIGQLVFQSVFILKKGWTKITHYWFNLMLVAGLGAVLLIPFLFLHRMFEFTDLVIISYFFIVVLIMFIDHRRRVHKLELPWYLCYTWVLYRCIILYFIV